MFLSVFPFRLQHLFILTSALGSNHPIDENNVVLWVEEGEAITRNMTYEKGRLIVEQEGYYYLYSKVQLNAAEDCKLIQHKVMKDTSAYGKPIDLMKSKRWVIALLVTFFVFSSSFLLWRCLLNNSLLLQVWVVTFLTCIFQLSLLDLKTFEWKGCRKGISVEQFPGRDFPPAEGG